jgi:hypothetical protein
MSSPFEPTEHFANIAVSEILSGTSALHMPPEPIPVEKQEPENHGYLSETDFMVKHSIEHFHHAAKLIGVSMNEVHGAKLKLIKLMTELIREGVINGENEEKWFPKFDAIFDQLDRA